MYIPSGTFLGIGIGVIIVYFLKKNFRIFQRFNSNKKVFYNKIINTKFIEKYCESQRDGDYGLILPVENKIFVNCTFTGKTELILYGVNSSIDKSSRESYNISYEEDPSRIYLNDCIIRDCVFEDLTSLNVSKIQTSH